MTRQEFEEQILKALDDITPQAQKPRQDEFQSVLEQFAQTLSKHPAIGAIIESVPKLPGGLHLVTWPKLRRDESSVMLVFARQGEALLLLGQYRHEFRTPAELERYLTQDFLRDSSFPETLAIYKESCTLPITGFLRKGGPNEFKTEDVLVHLAPEEQEKLAKSNPGDNVSVIAREDRLSELTSSFDSNETYTCLVAGGYGMWTRLCSRTEEGLVRMSGFAMSEKELA
jgi:hypothetical protein